MFGEHERLLAIPRFFQAKNVSRREFTAAGRIPATDAGEVFVNDTTDAYDLHGSDCVLGLYQLYDRELKALPR